LESQRLECEGIVSGLIINEDGELPDEELMTVDKEPEFQSPHVIA
jgi:hypothetical protein